MLICSPLGVTLFQRQRDINSRWDSCVILRWYSFRSVRYCLWSVAIGGSATFKGGVGSSRDLGPRIVFNKLSMRRPNDVASFTSSREVLINNIAIGHDLTRSTFVCTTVATIYM